MPQQPTEKPDTHQQVTALHERRLVDIDRRATLALPTCRTHSLSWRADGR